MAFLIPRKPSTSSSNSNSNSNSSTPSSSCEDDKSLAPHNNVTSCLYLKPKGLDEAVSSKSFEKEVVLRRIRQRKRVNRIRGTILSFLMQPMEKGDKDKEADGWLELDDAFSSP